MTSRTDDLGVRLQRATVHLHHGLAELADLEPTAPAEVAAVVSMLVHHLRSTYPEAVGPTGARWPSSPAEVAP